MDTNNAVHKTLLIAAPGIAIIEPIQEKNSQELQLATKTRGRIAKGKIISMGQNVITDANAILESKNYGKAGDVVYFLSYYEEGGYDYTSIDSKQIYMVKWQDFRGTERKDE